MTQFDDQTLKEAFIVGWLANGIACAGRHEVCDEEASVDDAARHFDDIPDQLAPYLDAFDKEQALRELDTEAGRLMRDFGRSASDIRSFFRIDMHGRTIRRFIDNYGLPNLAKIVHAVN